MRHTAEAFICPLCEAEFKVVRVDATAESPERPVFCPACATEFPAMENGTILKYFLVAQPRHA